MAKASRLRLERRRFIRRRTCLDAVSVSSAGSAPGVIRNLSTAGAFIESSARLPVGTHLRLGLPLPEEAERRDWVEGRVVHVVSGDPTAEPQGPVGGMGIALTPTPEQRDRLAKILERTGALPPAREPSPPRSPSRPSIGTGVCTDEARVRLDQLRPGQTRSVRLRLVTIGEGGKTPTDFFLDLKVTSPSCIDRWDACAKADFGENVPGAATMTVLKDRFETGSMLSLVEDGRCIEQEFVLPVDPSVEKIVFWVVTDGAGGVPERMACAIRLQSSTAEGLADDLDTMRLPSVKSVLSQSLAEVLRESPDPSLELLGKLMESHTLADKLHSVEQLVATKADLCLVEAGVRDIELWERMAKDFGKVDLDMPGLEDTADACLVVFHARSAPRRLAQALLGSFRKQFVADHPDEAAFWRRLALAAAIALCRRDRDALDEALETAREGFDAATAAGLATLVETATSRTRITPVDVSTRLGDYADDIRGHGHRKPLDAAVEFMAAAGLIALTAQPE